MEFDRTTILFKLRNRGFQLIRDKANVRKSSYPFTILRCYNYVKVLYQNVVNGKAREWATEVSV